MKYAVAYMNFYDNDLKLVQVEADNPIVALVEGVREMTEAADDDPWLNSFLADDDSTADYADRIETIREGFFDADAMVAVMPLT